MDFDLQKRAAKINTILLDKGIKKPPIMRVAVALDISGSMDHIIRSGALQNAFDHLMGVAVQFDDNGELDVFKFDTHCEYVGGSTPVKGDYDTFLAKNGIHARGGTSYAPIVDAAMDFFFKPQKKGGFLGFGAKTEPASDIPVLMMILTDGEPNDAAETQRRMQAAVNDPIYFHMVGVGGSRKDFRTIAKLADDLPNVGEVYLPHLNMTDDEIYSQLVCEELIEFIGKFAHNGPQAATA